jgi:hypothetical protein
MPSDDKPVATVVSFAATDDNSSFNSVVEKPISASAPGVLHQHQNG